MLPEDRFEKLLQDGMDAVAFIFEPDAGDIVKNDAFSLGVWAGRVRAALEDHREHRAQLKEWQDEQKAKARAQQPTASAAWEKRKEFAKELAGLVAGQEAKAAQANAQAVRALEECRGEA